MDRKPSANISTPTGGAAAARTPQEAERRQLTIMFCDLVESTSLSGRLDPEELRRVLRDYQAMCSTIIRRYDGTVAQYLGDGLLVYFGYPRAHEDDAQRAVHAGVGIVEAIDGLNTKLQEELGVRLALRLAIHTGLVVVGELGDDSKQEHLALGETPNLAARVQALAETGTVTITGPTFRLIEGLFECKDLGSHVLKGISQPLRLYQVLHDSTARSRLEVSDRTTFTPLVGRKQEMGLLLDRWEEVTEGVGQVVVLSGEAGVGKSRLLRMLKEHVSGNPQAWLTSFECSAYHQNSAFYPIIDTLERIVLQFSRNDTVQDRQAKLEGFLVQYGLSLPEKLPLFAALLSIPLPERYSPLTLTPERQKQEILTVLLTVLLKRAAKQPLLLVVEDLHWIDPSTLELLNLIVDQGPTTGILAVFTCRPDFDSPWTGRSHLTQVTLTRLTRRQVADMVARVAGGKTLPAELIQQIADKTDGVPLFVEELTKMVLESGLLKDHEDHYELSEPLPALAIPTTLQDSLMARLDRLATVKEVAQLAATLGREFTFELLKAVSPLEEKILERELLQLVEAGLLYQQGRLPQATFIFKHALIQDAAYQSLLKSKRQQYHRHIAEALEASFPETAEVRPEILAHHFSNAGLIEKAADYFARAARRAVANSTMAEAIAQVSKGLGILGALSDDRKRWRLQVELLAILGEALIATKGQAAPETGHAYTSARELWSKLGETPHLAAVLYGQFTNCLLRAEMDAASEIAAEFLRLAREQKDSAAEMVSLRCVGVSLLHLGKPAPACDHLEQSVALDEARRHRSLSYISPANLRVSALAYLGMGLALSARREEALARVREALGEAQRLARPLAWAATLGITWRVQYLARDTAMLSEQAQTLVSVATEQRFPYYLSLGTFYSGYALALGERVEEGTTLMRDGLANYRATDTRWLIPFFLMLLAEACAKAGRADEGLEHLKEAASTVERTNERWCEAEIMRSKGQLLLALADEDGAQACFHQALTLAKDQGARLWELRAARSCARLWGDRGRRDEARDLLTPVLGLFTQGFDSPDLQEAKALLDELGR